MSRLSVLSLGLLLLLPGSALAADAVTVSSYAADFGSEERTKLEAAVAVANRVLASDAFRAELAAIGGFNYTGDDGAAVHSKLLGQRYALEFAAVAKYAVRVRVFGRTISRKSNMVASTGEGSGRITFNTVRMPEFDVAFYAGTIVHELTHIAGYHHRGNRATSANQRSVPYRVGELVRRLASADTSAPAAGPATPSAPATGLVGALGDAQASSGDADADAARPRPTFAARIRRTLARWFGR